MDDGIVLNKKNKEKFGGKEIKAYLCTLKYFLEKCTEKERKK
jgi:hypothetical protein